jgi:hypothetical protein
LHGVIKQKLIDQTGIFIAAGRDTTVKSSDFKFLIVIIAKAQGIKHLIES